jgi:hypothetical protein
MQLTCAISKDVLLERFGGTQAMDVFCENRWDLEEEASDLIRDQQEDDQGWVWIS